MSNHGRGRILPDHSQDIQSAIQNLSHVIACEFGLDQPLSAPVAAPLCDPVAAIILRRITDDLTEISNHLDPDFTLDREGTEWAREKLEKAIADLRFIQDGRGA
ncbi:hypothetical protein [Thalassospira marina]|uniref:Uncharacterized protein n=1 Tax=Thalassospira marina TaxID=2048283 RepID=A0A2N3KUJ5_9PROT|nr:hypothetical protein [Thalassospira marina]PKR54239.1 hypothetical protein COO20_08815 [Thalassospira marina]